MINNSNSFTSFECFPSFLLPNSFERNIISLLDVVKLFSSSTIPLCFLKASIHFFQTCISKLLNRICHLPFFLLCLQNWGVFTAVLFIKVKINLVFWVVGEQVVCFREKAGCKKYIVCNIKKVNKLKNPKKNNNNKKNKNSPVPPKTKASQTKPKQTKARKWMTVQRQVQSHEM